MAFRSKPRGEGSGGISRTAVCVTSPPFVLRIICNNAAGDITNPCRSDASQCIYSFEGGNKAEQHRPLYFLWYPTGSTEWKHRGMSSPESNKTRNGTKSQESRLPGVVVCGPDKWGCFRIPHLTPQYATVTHGFIFFRYIVGVMFYTLTLLRHVHTTRYCVCVYLNTFRTWYFVLVLFVVARLCPSTAVYNNSTGCVCWPLLQQQESSSGKTRNNKWAHVRSRLVVIVLCTATTIA